LTFEILSDDKYRSLSFAKCCSEKIAQCHRTIACRSTVKSETNSVNGRFRRSYLCQCWGYVFDVVCLFACLSVAKTSERICMKFSGKVDNGPLNKGLNFGGDPDHRLDTGIVFRIRHYWETRKVVSTDCAARRWSAGHALAGITIATMTSLRHRSMIDSGTDISTLVRRALAEVCAVPVLLVGTGNGGLRHLAQATLVSSTSFIDIILYRSV